MIRRLRKVTESKSNIRRAQRVRRLNESFNSSMPSWIKSNIELIPNYSQLAKESDLYNAEFVEDSVPTSNRDKRLKDPDRVNFFLVDLGEVQRLLVYKNDSWFTPLRDYNFRSWSDVVDNTIAYAYTTVDYGKQADELRAKRREFKEVESQLYQQYELVETFYNEYTRRIKQKYSVELGKHYFDECDNTMADLEAILANSKNAIAEFMAATSTTKLIYQDTFHKDSFFNRIDKILSSLKEMTWAIQEIESIFRKNTYDEQEAKYVYSRLSKKVRGVKASYEKLLSDLNTGVKKESRSHMRPARRISESNARPKRRVSQQRDILIPR